MPSMVERDQCRVSGRTSPITHFINVLLPLPFVPRIATVSPDH